MIRPIAAFLHALDAARTAGTLSRTVLVLSRQLDNAHLLAASEGARADRTEAALATARANVADQKRCWTNHANAQRQALNAARERVAELEHQLEDWAELSGELAADPQADALPDLTDAGEAPIPIEPPPDAYHERDRADRLQAMLQACEVDLATARAQLQQTECAAGAHLATINDLRKRLDDALRAVHKPAPAEQIPGVAAAARPIWFAEYDAREAARATAGTDDPPPRIAPREVRYAAVMKVSAEIDAAADDPPPTRPSSATRTT